MPERAFPLQESYQRPDMGILSHEEKWTDHRYFKDEIERSQRNRTVMSLILFEVDEPETFHLTQKKFEVERVRQSITQKTLNAIQGSVPGILWKDRQYLIFLPRVDKEQARTMAERIRSTIQFEMMDLQITISGGVSSLKFNESNKEMLVLAADRALNRAIVEGRNRICTDPCWNEDVMSVQRSIYLCALGFHRALIGSWSHKQSI